MKSEKRPGEYQLETQRYRAMAAAAEIEMRRGRTMIEAIPGHMQGVVSVQRDSSNVWCHVHIDVYAPDGCPLPQEFVPRHIQESLEGQWPLPDCRGIIQEVSETKAELEKLGWRVYGD